MSIKKVLLYPEEEVALRRKSVEVKRKDKSIKQLIQDLKDTLIYETGAGLAAPQIGIHKRVVLVGFGQDEEWVEDPMILINPEIIQQGELVAGFDGCLSLPGLVTWDTLRPEWLIFTAYDENWEKFTMKVDGADARVVSHEIDHLNGVLYIDYLNAKTKLFAIQYDDKGEEKLLDISQLYRRR